MDIFRHFLAVICSSVNYTSVFSFPDDSFRKYQCIFIKFGMNIDIVAIRFVIVMGRISLIFDSYLFVCCTSVRPYFRFSAIT